MDLVINEDNLLAGEVDKVGSKVRAILIDSENRVLVAHYGGVILLPGGSIDDVENINEAIKRELNEELGITYSENELNFLGVLNYFQKNYINRKGMVLNRLMKTYYFVGVYKDIDFNNQHLTDREKKDGFSLELIPIEKIEQVVLDNINDNPRNIYFQKELLEVIKYYKEAYKKRLIL